eukprot:CAMPEP_0172669308 /NCGR_PEP_ID=MMETSP1074-20121228/9594_1 /TAXON_ID=2916 /ORGANISM="Ceratium fusus, Strain PA161109" /LENGTH=808 /DNA_ID=CAMNT_0013486065 /DNA_START=108 /DNA_END=2531 /DNA_ORIENTATION=+
MSPLRQPDIVVFLDVDGVLHSLYGDEIFNESCCKLLEEILLATGAAVVLSSSWREDARAVALLNEMLQSRQLLPVHDCTRVLGGSREEEICEWLRRHPNVKRWVAIDDLDLQSRGTAHANSMRGHFVHTCKNIGLTPKNAELARTLLLGKTECGPCVGVPGSAFPRFLSLPAETKSMPFELQKSIGVTTSPQSTFLRTANERCSMSWDQPHTMSPQRQSLQPKDIVSVGCGAPPRCHTNKASPRGPRCTSDLIPRQLHKWPTHSRSSAPQLSWLDCAAFADDDALAALVCTESSTANLDQITMEYRSLVLRPGGSPWDVGWRRQGLLFARLVPDGELRACISQHHFELEWDPFQVLWLRPTSAAPILIDGVPMVKKAVVVTHGMQIGLCGGLQNETFLMFTAVLRDVRPPFTGWLALDVWPCISMQPVPGEWCVEQPMQLSEQPWQLMGNEVPDLPNSSATGAAGSKAEVGADTGTAPAVSSVAGHASTAQVLLCTYSVATDIMLLPESARCVALPAYGTLLLGRSHQADLFEVLLGSCSTLLKCVSRVHLSLTINHEEPRFIEITNLSVSAVRLSGHILKHGERATVEAPAEISFLNCTCGTNPLLVETLLTFTVCSWQPEQRQAPQQAQQHAQQYAQQHALQLAQQQAQLTKSHVEEEIIIEVPPALIQERFAFLTEQPDFCLELGGTAVLAGLPLESRRVLPKVGCELVIGRSFQSQLLLQAICEDALKWVSRAHFRIECGVDGMCHFVLLSGHPTWLLRFGRRERIKSRQPMAIQRGDLILLYTGASDGSADGIDGAGTLHWIC